MMKAEQQKERVKEMKKILLIFGLVLLSTFVGVGLFFNKTVALNLKTVEIKETQQVRSKNIESLQLSSTAVDVRVVPTSGETISVELSGKVSEKMKNAFKLHVEDNGEELVIELERKNNVFQLFAINRRTLLEVKVPIGQLQEADIKTVSGDIEVEELIVDQLAIHSTSGDIETENNEVKSDFELEVVSGDIVSQNDRWGELLTKAISGDIVIDLNKNMDSVSLDFKGTSGDGDVLVNGFRFEEKSENRILGILGDAEHSIVAKTTSGDFILK